MKIVDFFIANMTKIVRILCSIGWGLIGLVCLYAAWMMWRFSMTELGNPMGTGVERAVSVVFFLFTVLFLFYAFLQMKKESQLGLVRFFQKKVPGLILMLLAYGVFIAIICFTTIGEISLRSGYARPVQIVGGILILLDLCVNLGLFPDQWGRSPVVRWFVRKAEKNK